jgi:hypothetical protein
MERNFDVWFPLNFLTYLCRETSKILDLRFIQLGHLHMCKIYTKLVDSKMF